jgi:methylenetetrahydrofolate--tRNA-(uracil-5-)-methyltransferase
MNANFGLLDELPQRIRDKRQKREMFAERALGEMQAWIEANGIASPALARA